MEVEDSFIQIRHSELEASHNTIKEEHVTVFNGQDILCVAIGASHHKLIAEHDAILERHKALVTSYTEFEKKHLSG